MSDRPFLLLVSIHEHAFDHFQHLRHGIRGHVFGGAAEMKAELIQYGCEFELEVRAKKLVILTQSLQRISERWTGAQERVFKLADHDACPVRAARLAWLANSGGCSMSTRRAFSAFVMAAILLAASRPSQAQNPALKERFEKQVQEYEAGDRKNPPPPDAILFVGDSQFFRWKTIHEDLAGYTLINRGIDSFQLPDLIHFADRLVFPYRPRLIVLHVGGNDLHNGRTPGQLLADFQSFVAIVRARLPDVRIVYSSITPGPGRWDEAPQRVVANRAIQAYIATQKNLDFVDLWGAMLTPDGRPREDLWVEDRVHPNHAGYLIRANLTKPLLGSPR